jgi:hypothetical protein
MAAAAATPASVCRRDTVVLVVMLFPSLHRPWLQVRGELSVGWPTFVDCCLSDTALVSSSVGHEIKY